MFPPLSITTLRRLSGHAFVIFRRIEDAAKCTRYFDAIRRAEREVSHPRLGTGDLAEKPHPLYAGAPHVFTAESPRGHRLVALYAQGEVEGILNMAERHFRGK